PGEVAPERKPNAAANDIDAMATERTASESRRRLKIAGFGRWPRGRMVPFPPGIAARPPHTLSAIAPTGPIAPSVPYRSMIFSEKSASALADHAPAAAIRRIAMDTRAFWPMNLAHPLPAV